MMTVSIVILAGGEGSRIGGNKGLQLLRGKPLVRWVLDAVREQGGELLISANGPGYEDFGCRVIADEMPGMGPLGGLQAALRLAQNALVMSVPCDVPFLPYDLAACLLAGLGEADAAVAVVAGKRQPAIALYRQSVLPRLDAYLTKGERRVGSFLDGLGAREVEFTDAKKFININTKEELESAGLDSQLIDNE